MYDLIIIGAGPAGITAGIYAARRKIKQLIICKDIGGQATWSGKIENFIGFQFISGPELAAKFEEHIKKFGIELKEKEEVLEIKKTGNIIYVKTYKNIYEAKTVIIASGKRAKELNVLGEKEFKNRGLTYCAICDAPLFAGKDVAVIGGGNSAMDAVLQLINIAKNVYVINNIPELHGDCIMKEKVENSNVVTIYNNAEVKAVLGDKIVTGIKIMKDGSELQLSVQGIFVEIGLIPSSDFTKDVIKNDEGEIKIDSYNQTNIQGIFAAGDVSDVHDKQIIIAAGEGAKAALSAFRYLAQSRF